MPTTASTMTALQPGDRLDKYEVRDTIGSGGMATVYKGYDALLDRFVAIKQINTDLASESGDEGLLERFRKEARLQKRAALQSKHLVSFIDFIEEPRGLFIIQEFVDGVSLEQVLTTRPNPMDQRQALGIIGAVTLALQAIHAKSIVHRDLKPSNILLPHDGGLKVCDFGLAASIAEQDALPLGSVRYMAPELFRGEQVDGRADIYALGMVAYEMLLGRAAFNEAFKIVLRDQRNQALRWMKWHTNARVRATPLNQINPSISDTLSDLVSRMMEKDPQARIQSADELLETIRRHFTPGAAPDKRIVDDTREVARKTPAHATAAATARLPNRSRLPLVLVALLAVNVLTGLGLWAWYANEQAAKAQARRDQAQQLLEDAKAMYDRRDFSSAFLQYQQVFEVWPDDPGFRKVAQAGMLMSQGQLDLLAKRFEEAYIKFGQADELGVIRDRAAIADLRRQAAEDGAFEKEITKIEALRDEGRFSEAIFELNRQFARDPVGPKRQRLEQLEAQVRQSMNQFEIDRLAARIDELVAADRRDKAIENLREWVPKYPGSKLQTRLDQLQADADYDNLMAQAAAAESRGDSAQTVEILRRAIDRRSGDSEADAANQDRIRRLMVQVKMREALAALESGQEQEAARLFNDVRGYDPDNQQAAQYLKQIEFADEKREIVRAGDQAMASRQFDVAITHYSNALRFGPDPELADKLRNARLQDLLEKFQIEMSYRRIDAARQALAEAERYAPDDPEVQLRRTQLQQWTQVLGMIDEGDAAARDGRYAPAVDIFRSALARAREFQLPQAVLDEIQQRINRVEYESLLARARFELEAGRLASAKAYLQILQKQPDGNTEEVQSMLADIARREGP